MIELANAPNASRGSWRPAANDEKAPVNADAPRRSGHAWPFLSPHAARPARQDRPRDTSKSSGS